MKKKKNMVGVFFSMFLKATVIILALVIVAIGVMLTKKLIAKQEAEAKQTEDVNSIKDESVFENDGDYDSLLENTEEQNDVVDEPQTVNSKEKKIEVLNGTSTKGLAGKWTEKLQGEGYTDVNAHNYYNHADTTRIIVAEEGYGQDLLQYFSNAEIEYGTLTSDDTDASVDGVDIFIVVGDSDDIVSGE